ncbi:MAG: MFS transporter [Acidimicrobiales bacterium]|jgi:MFS family permease|nr:MFS transporter [Acidimicrobiales bacterium]
MPTPKSARIFRGWIVLAGLFILLTVSAGFAFYAQGIFLDALVREQGFSVGMAGAGTGTFFISSGIAGYFAGGLISKYDARSVMTVGAFIGAGGLALIAQISTEWQMFPVMAIFGTGFALTSLVPTSSIVTRWFHRQRSVALSIASSGLSLGGILISPLIASAIDEDGLIAWAPRLGFYFLISLLPAIWLLIKPSPEAMGLYPDGDEPANNTTSASQGLPGVDFATAIRSRYFILISLSFILIMSAQVGAIQHIFKLTKDRFDIETAQLTLMVLSGTSVVARILGGIAAMRISLSWITSCLVGVQAIGISLIALDTNSSIVSLTGVVVLGSAMGNLLMLHPLLLAHVFGIRDYPRIYGLGSLLMVFGVGSGPFLVGVIRDAWDYQTAFLVMAVFAFLGLLIFLTAKPPTELMSLASFSSSAFDIPTNAHRPLIFLVEPLKASKAKSKTS